MTTYGPRAGESPGDYLARLHRERLAPESGSPLPSDLPPATAANAPPAPAEPDLATAQAAATASAAAIDAADAANYGSAGAAWHKVGRALGDITGRIIEKVRWASGRVFNPKMLAVNVKAPRKYHKPPDNWAKKVAADFLACRVKGDVSVPFFENFINKALLEEARKGFGYVQHGLKFLADLGHQGRETARKIIRWLEDRGWIGTLNTLYRDEKDRSLRRGNNVYLLFDKETADEIAAVEEPEERAKKRESITLARGALLWNLVVRPWGLNATPVASNRHEILSNPAPA